MTKQMKILIADLLDEAGVELFRNEPGFEVETKTGLTKEQLKRAIHAFDALIIRSATKVTEEILESSSRLKVVARAGIGLDNVDVPAATKHGVLVDAMRRALEAFRTPTALLLAAREGLFEEAAQHALKARQSAIRDLSADILEPSHQMWSICRRSGSGMLTRQRVS